MKKEIVIGKNLKSHIALLWCQWNAKEISSDTFVKEIQKLIPNQYLKEKWIWYHTNKNTMSQKHKHCKTCGDPYCNGWCVGDST